MVREKVGQIWVSFDNPLMVIGLSENVICDNPKLA